MSVQLTPALIQYNDGTTQNTVGSSGTTKVRIYTGNPVVNFPFTWTNPLATTPATTYGGLKGLRVTLVGGGGGGSASRSVNYPTNSFWESYGAPGGSGGFTVQKFSTIGPGSGIYNLPSTPITISIGGGGAGGTVPGGSGASGGTTSFGSLISVTGGAGGTTFANSYGGTIGVAGTNNGYPILTGGGPTIAPGAVVNLYGASGAYGPLSGGAGTAATGYGGFGGAGTTPPFALSPSPTTPGNAGGQGAPGLVIIEEFY